jgi:glycosyltransferase involved in cell wall biosynthesis
MAVHNGEKYLREALESILEQTFTDFEFVIIDDGSTDQTADIIKSYPDPRIIALKNETNLNLSASLNRGLKIARGAYIARMDADDISRPGRLQAQFDFLESHPDIGLCGAWIKIIGADKIWKMPARADLIPALLLFGPQIFHPTAFWRRESFSQNNLFYNETFGKSQDYELWARAAKFIKLANLKKVLLDYRVTEGQIKDFQASAWRQNLLNSVRLKLVEELLPETTPAEAELHIKIASGQIGNDSALLAAAEKWLSKLAAANSAKKIYPAKPFVEVMRQQWLTLVRRSPKNAFEKIKLLIASPLFGRNKLAAALNFLILAVRIKLS